MWLQQELTQAVCSMDERNNHEATVPPMKGTWNSLVFQTKICDFWTLFQTSAKNLYPTSNNLLTSSTQSWWESINWRNFHVDLAIACSFEITIFPWIIAEGNYFYFCTKRGRWFEEAIVSNISHRGSFPKYFYYYTIKSKLITSNINWTWAF